MLIKTSKMFFVIVFAFLMTGTLVYSTNETKNLQSIVLEDFELGTDGQPRRQWAAFPSTFGREGNLPSGRSLQDLGWVTAWPEAYFGREGMYDSGSGPQPYKTSLGLRTRFTRRGYNNVDLVPLAKNAAGDLVPSPIPFRGKVEMIDMWIWGANYNFDVEVVLIDYRGVEHRLPLGNIRHSGWKNFVVNIPSYIPQAVDYIPNQRVLSLVKVVLWTQPNEQVEQFAHVYFDHIKYLSDIFEVKYDGYNLGVPEHINTIWNTENGEAIRAPSDSEVKR